MKSRGTCNTTLVSPGFDGTKARVRDEKFLLVHDRRGFAFRRRRFSAQPTASNYESTQASTSAVESYREGGRYQSELLDEALKESEVTPTKVVVKQRSSEGNDESTPQSAADKSFSTPPFTPASSQLDATPSSKSRSPVSVPEQTTEQVIFHEDDEFPTNSLLSNVRRCDVMSDDENEKEWLINEE